MAAEAKGSRLSAYFEARRKSNAKAKPERTEVLVDDGGKRK